MRSEQKRCVEPSRRGTEATHDAVRTLTGVMHILDTGITFRHSQIATLPATPSRLMNSAQTFRHPFRPALGNMACARVRSHGNANVAFCKIGLGCCAYSPQCFIGA